MKMKRGTDFPEDESKGIDVRGKVSVVSHQHLGRHPKGSTRYSF